MTTGEMEIAQAPKRRGCLGFFWKFIRFGLVLLGLTLIFNVYMGVRVSREAARIAADTDYGKAFESLDFKGSSRTGVLLLHGIHGTPQDFKLLLPMLEEKNISYYAPMLGGDRPSPAVGLGFTEESLARHAEQAYQHLAGRCERVVVVGFSMGAIQGTDLAAKHPIAGLAVISPPYALTKRWYLWPSAEKLARVLSPAIPLVPTGRASTEIPYVGLENVALTAIAEMADYSKHVLEQAEKVKAPLLCIISKGDYAIDPPSAEAGAVLLASEPKTIVWYEDSGHLIFADVDRDKAIAEVAKFILERAAQ